MSDLRNRILEVSVLNNNKLNVKDRIGLVQIRLFGIDFSKDFVKWYDLLYS